METRTNEVNGVATKTWPAFRKSVFGGNEQGCSGKSVRDSWETVSEISDETSNDQMETLPESSKKSLSSKQSAPRSNALQKQPEAKVKAEAVVEDTKAGDIGKSSGEHETKDTPETHTENPGKAEGLRSDVGTPAKASTENSTQTDDVGDDNWLDNWDLTMRRCTQCNRAFATQQRLLRHLSRWHAPDSEPLAPHIKPETPETSNIFAADTPLIKIVEDGDLILDVGSGSDTNVPHKRFLVASQALWATSPVFKAMLGPKSKFQEGLNIRRASIFGYPTPVVKLEDEPNAMECILKALFHQQPSIFGTFNEILNVAIVADKYEMQDVMAGWAANVMTMVHAWADSPGKEDAIFIAWVFGYGNTFEKAFTALTLSSHLDPNNQLAFRNADGPSTKLCENTPSVIIDKLIQIRAKRVNNMRARIVSHSAKYTSTLSFCSGTEEVTRPHCHALQSGHFIQNYNVLELGNEERWSERTLMSYQKTCRRSNRW